MSAADQAALYAAIERDVETIRKLAPNRPVTPVILDDAGLRAELELHSAEDNPPAELARQERLLKALGVLAPDADLDSIMRAFLTAQIAGFYRPKDGHLYVVSRSGEIGGVERTTFAHEYTHALQDQHFPLLQQLGGTAGEPENGDRDLAHLSLIEGDATLVMSLWAQRHLSGLELLQLLRSSLDPGQQAALAAMPPFLRESALFPYQSGLQFVTTVQARGVWDAVDAAFTPGPDSTEQILHPDKWATREAPVPVTLPADLATKIGSGWSEDPEDTLGEFQIRTWLAAAGGPTSATTVSPTEAAAGWGGDRVAVLRGPNGAWALALRTIWDGDRDAIEFATAASAFAGAGGRNARVVDGASSTERWLLMASSADVLTLVERATTGG
jgi:hypothetical protein